MEIQHTKNYEIFKKLDGNRHLDKSHLKKLRLAIEKENLLAIHPIIVNKDYYVIDGQHRLQIAQDLGLEIFYLKSDTVSDFHVVSGNVNQKSFDMENYIDYFAIKERNSVYILLKDLMNSTGLKPKALLNLVLGSVSISILDFLKTGKFRFPQSEDPIIIIDFYLDFKAYVNDKKIRPMSMFTNHSFTKALRWLFKTSNFQKQTLFKKLDMKWFELKPQHNSEEWYKLLISIYNFKNHERLNDEWTDS